MSQEQLLGRKCGHHSNQTSQPESLCISVSQDVAFFVCSRSSGDFEGTSSQLYLTSGNSLQILGRAAVSASVVQFPYVQIQNVRYLRSNTKYNAGPKDRPIVFVPSFGEYNHFLFVTFLKKSYSDSQDILKPLDCTCQDY